LAPKDRPLRLERPGQILFGVGLAVAAVGGILIAHGVTGATNFEEPVFVTFGASLVIMGGVATAVGIPLWVIGASRSKR
jgi:hypothetical protein